MYRNGVYVAFDGNGEVDPTKSDFKYLALLRAWNENEDIDFNFSDSHKKTYQVRNDSEKKTLENRLMERMSNSKNMLLILSDDTNYDRGFLNFEIEKAVETYNLPLIICYIGYKSILHVSSHRNKWPKKLREYIDNGEAKCVHIPFNKDVIFYSINRYGVNYNYPKSSTGYYGREMYRDMFGIE